MRNVSPHMQFFLPYSPYTYGDNPYMHMGITEIPVCIRGLHDMQSPYACGDKDQSLYA